MKADNPRRKRDISADISHFFPTRPAEKMEESALCPILQSKKGKKSISPMAGGQSG
jgi:hypothetical protein